MNTNVLPGLVLLLIAALPLSCAVDSRRSYGIDVPEPQYQMNIMYDYQRKSFDFKLTSLVDKRICVSKMRWPDEEGRHYLYGDRLVYFTNEGTRYDLKDRATGFCSAKNRYGCMYRLQKNESLSGRLPIDSFRVDSDVYSSKGFSPSLEYPYRPFFCP